MSDRCRCGAGSGRWRGWPPVQCCWWRAAAPARTVHTHAWRTRFQGHAGNLEFYVRVTYIAEELPPETDVRITEVFRDLVLAVVDGRERAPE